MCLGFGDCILLCRLLGDALSEDARTSLRRQECTLGGAWPRPLLATGSGAVFSKLTWGAYWNWDPRQTTIFVLLLIYGAYVTLRMTMRDERARASSSAVYALFSFIAVPFLVFILPRMFFSLHPSPVINEAGRLDMDAVMLGTLLLSLLDVTLIYVWLMKRGDRHA